MQEDRELRTYRVTYLTAVNVGVAIRDMVKTEFVTGHKLYVDDYGMISLVRFLPGDVVQPVFLCSQARFIDAVASEEIVSMVPAIEDVPF